MKALLITSITCIAIATTYAGTVDSSVFNGVTDSAVSTAGTLGYGYLSYNDTLFDGIFDSDLPPSTTSYNDTDFGKLINGSSNALTTVGGSYTNVTLTEGTAGTDTIDSRGAAGVLTFDGNTTHGNFGSMASNEGNVWTINFNDLGIGTRLITLYMGHNASNRKFDMDYSLADGGAPLTGTTTMPMTINDLGSTVAIGGGWAFTYEITVTTVTAGSDVSLTFGSVSGNSGAGYLSGYTVVNVPPSSGLMFIVH